MNRPPVFLVIVFWTLLLPQPACAEEEKDNVIESMCKQIIAADVELSPKVLLEKTIDKTKEIPEKLLAIAAVAGEQALDYASNIPESISDSLQSLKKSDAKNTIAKAGETQVLGDSADKSLTASAYNAGIDLLSLLIREWQWTLGGLAVLGIVWSFRA